jgi:DNA transposition AAA+ family ATPase
MNFDFDFPEPRNTQLIETGMMKWAMQRLLSAHPDGGFCAWSGRAGIGKTTTAEYMVKLIMQKYDPNNPRAFKAIHYEAGAVAEWSKHEMKRGIRSLYCGVDYRLDEGLYRGYLPEELATDLVHFLKKMNIQLIFVDEAGCLSLNAIRGLVLVSDTARNMGWTLTIVLIGMDDLPHKLTRSPQVERRVIEWCYFKPYSLKETHQLLGILHSYFGQLSTL